MTFEDINIVHSWMAKKMMKRVVVSTGGLFFKMKNNDPADPPTPSPTPKPPPPPPFFCFFSLEDLLQQADG